MHERAADYATQRWKEHLSESALRRQLRYRHDIDYDASYDRFSEASAVQPALLNDRRSQPSSAKESLARPDRG